MIDRTDEAEGGDASRTQTEADDRSRRALSPAAKRALAEADERRRQAANAEARTRAKELGGRDGPDPARYGDWEKDGIASDF